MRSLKQLRRLWRSATTAREREALLAEATALARRAKTKAGAEDVARTFPFPAVQAAAAVVWSARAAVLEDFVDWLESVDAWCATQPRGVVARIPVRLWPSRMAHSARTWANGTGGRDPVKMRTQFVWWQGEALARHDGTENPAVDVDTFLGWAGVTGAWEVNGTSHPNAITATDFSDAIELVAEGATRYRIALIGWEEDLAPVPDGYVLVQASVGGSWVDKWAVDFADTSGAEAVISQANVAAWRIKFAEDFVSLNFRPQFHVWRRDAV